MSQDYGIIPRLEHYACMVDLFGRAGCLDEAENLIKEMPLECGSMVWQALLVACRVHGNMDMGKRVAENILEMEPEDPTTYGILSTIHTAAGRWEDVAKVQELMKDRGVKMEPGQSWIEVKSRVHKFVARDISHPQMEEIYIRLEELTRQMKEAGYIPNTYVLMHEVEEKQNE
jgi:pentatricopeptide repeat protein